MVVASSTPETLERALGVIGKSFAVVKRPGHLEVVEDIASGFGSNGDGELADVFDIGRGFASGVMSEKSKTASSVKQRSHASQSAESSETA